MISFFRRLISSKLGVIFMIAFVGIIAVAFVAGDLQNTSMGGGTTVGGGERVLSVGEGGIGANELSQRVRREYGAARQQRPDLTFEQYLAGGAVDQVADRMLTAYALEEYAGSQGMLVSNAAEVARIQALPVFRGLDGRFDRAAFDSTLRQIGMTEAEFRDEVGREMLASQLLTPVAGGARPPLALVRAQANLLLEGRSGQSVFIPVTSISLPAPTDAEVQQYYQRNVQRYTVPERRIARYAIVDRATVPVAAPTEQEIAAAYRREAGRFGARETRTLTQVIVPDEAAARAIAGRVRAGATLADAARAAGVEAATLADQTRDAYAQLSSAAVAARAFQAAEGSVTEPARSGLGWHVVRVDGIESTAATPLETARPELAEQLTTAKRDEALSALVGRVQDQIGGGATFAEAAQATGLQVQASPALLPDGRTPDATGAPDPLAVQVARALFGSEPDDDPVIQEIVPQQRYAIVDVAQVVPAAAPPLAQIRQRVVADLTRNRALGEARRIANDIARRAQGPATLAQAVSGSGRSLSPTSVSATRQELAGQVQPQASALFALRQGAARAFEAPDGSGWYVVHLDTIRPGNAAGNPQLIQAAAGLLSQQIAQEYAEQFIAAARGATGASIDRAALARLRQSLAGGQ